MYYFAVSFATLFTYVLVLDNGIVERITQQWMVHAFASHTTSLGNHRDRARDLMSVLRYNLCTPEVDFHVHWTLINKKIIDLEC